MRHRIFLAAATAAALFAATAAPARAGLWTGACALRVRLDFSSPMRGPLDGGGYQLDVAAVADLDPTKVGAQPCAATLSAEVTTGTSVSGAGTATVWSCGAMAGGGTWHQTFDPEGPAGFSGSHRLAGAWGAWTLQVANPSLTVVGVGELTLQAAEGTKTPACALGQMDSVTMVGTLVFQDP